MRKIAVLGILLLFVCGAVVTAQENDQETYSNITDQEDDSDSTAQAAGSKKLDLDAIRDAFPIKFQAYGQGTWAPFVYRARGTNNPFDVDALSNKENTEGGFGVGSGPGWDANATAAVGIRVYGSNSAENIGFDLRLRAVPSFDGERIDIKGSDNTSYLWAKPFGGLYKDVLKVQFGAYQWDEFRGKMGGLGGWDHTSGVGEDDIFRRVVSDVFGALFILKPPAGFVEELNGLTLFGSFGVSGGFNYREFKETFFAARGKNSIKEIFSHPHAGIAYENEAFGLARAQFIASNYLWGTGEDWLQRQGKRPFYGTTLWTIGWFSKRWEGEEAARVEFAVNLTSVPNLNLDLGVGIPFKVTVGEKDDGNAAPLVGPYLNERGNRDKELWTFNENKKITRDKGDVWRPPVLVAAGLDYSMAGFGLPLGFRFRTRMEFGEQVAYIDPLMSNLIGGFKLSVGLEPYYELTAINSTVSLVLGLRLNQNDSLTYKGTVSDRITMAYSLSHNGLIDLGLGTYFTRHLGKGNRITLGVIANLPVGGDRYKWSANSIPNLSEGETSYFSEKVTEAYRKGNLLVAVPITIELNL